MNVILRNIFLGLSLAAPLGPSSIAVLQNGLRQGFLRAFVTGLGVTMADATYLLLVFFGLSRFLEVTAVRIGVWAVGAVALTTFGLRSLREARQEIDLQQDVAATARNPLLTGFIVNASNPIAAVWWLGVFGSLLSESAAEASRLSALLSSATILVGILMWHTTASMLSHWGRRFVNERWARLVSLLAGVALLLFGLRFAYNAVLAALGG